MRLIHLTQNQQTKISDEDADLAGRKWYAKFNKSYANGGNYIAGCNTSRMLGKRRTLLMHRLILERMLGRELSRKELVDHIDGNPLNNQRVNLRLASPTQNQQNRGVSKRNLAGFKGVDFSKKMSKYRARIRYNGELIHLGYFDTVEAAYTAYKLAAKRYFGEFARFE